MQINPGIQRLVAILVAHGFETCDSGDGETHDYACDRLYPYVSMRVMPYEAINETARLKNLISGLGATVVSMTEAFGESPVPTSGCIQLSYDPCDKIAILDLLGVKDTDLTKVKP